MATEQLTLIERPCLEVSREISSDLMLAAGNLPLRTSVVVGMALRERPPEIMSDYDTTGDESRRALQLTKSHARRWAEFFNKHMASRANHHHDSESIVRYVLGMDIVTMHDPSSWQPIRFTDARPHQLELGQGYAIMDRADRAKCFAYGIGDPALCLSTLGIGQPLIVTPLDELITLFNGHHLRKVFPTIGPTRYRFSDVY